MGPWSMSSGKTLTFNHSLADVQVAESGPIFFMLLVFPVIWNIVDVDVIIVVTVRVSAEVRSLLFLMYLWARSCLISDKS